MWGYSSREGGKREREKKQEGKDPIDLRLLDILGLYGHIWNLTSVSRYPCWYYMVIFEI